MSDLMTRDDHAAQAAALYADEIRAARLYDELCAKLTPLADAARELLATLRGTGEAIREREEFLHALQAALAVNNDAFTGGDYAELLPTGVDLAVAIRKTVATMEREVCPTS